MFELGFGAKRFFGGLEERLVLVGAEPGFAKGFLTGGVLPPRPLCAKGFAFWVALVSAACISELPMKRDEGAPAGVLLACSDRPGPEPEPEPARVVEGRLPNLREKSWLL